MGKNKASDSGLNIMYGLSLYESAVGFADRSNEISGKRYIYKCKLKKHYCFYI